MVVGQYLLFFCYLFQKSEDIVFQILGFQNNFPMAVVTLIKFYITLLQ
jgi:hypothetical protein